ncbi:MAG TPA: hypothetical protein VKD91_22050 [Pyrinomonadaceae bacterium]|nr:hypothetical protein [Pyrinomonadaceae bacterium]
MNVNGLRVYVDPEVAETCGGQGVFYCRREDGPYYRWAYEEKVSRWRFARVKVSDFSSRTYCPADWNGVPASLQKRMVEHYED